MFSSGVQSSLHQNCHYQIVFTRSNLKVVFPPAYEHEVRHFKKANVYHIRKAIHGFQWEKSFQNMNVNDMFIYLIELSKIYYKILFRMNQSHVMTEIHLGLMVH